MSSSSSGDSSISRSSSSSERKKPCNKYSKVNIRLQKNHDTDNFIEISDGENEGKLMGAQDITLNDQKYIASEAPFNKEDYYRMLVTKGSCVAVSFLNDSDIDNEEKQKIYKGKLGRHHLKEGEKVKFKVDGIKHTVTCTNVETLPTGEIVHTLKVEKKVGGEYIDVEDNPTISLVNITDWNDLETSDNAHEILKRNTERVDDLQQKNGGGKENPIAVNCFHGQNRTGAFIRSHACQKHLQKHQNDIPTRDHNRKNHLTDVKNIISSLYRKQYYNFYTKLLKKQNLLHPGDAHLPAINKFLDHAASTIKSNVSWISWGKRILQPCRSSPEVAI